jgi:hypothetical protein
MRVILMGVLLASLVSFEPLITWLIPSEPAPAVESAVASSEDFPAGPSCLRLSTLGRCED